MQAGNKTSCFCYFFSAHCEAKQSSKDRVNFSRAPGPKLDIVDSCFQRDLTLSSLALIPAIPCSVSVFPTRLELLQGWDHGLSIMVSPLMTQAMNT